MEKITSQKNSRATPTDTKQSFTILRDTGATTAVYLGASVGIAGVFILFFVFFIGSNEVNEKILTFTGFLSLVVSAVTLFLVAISQQKSTETAGQIAHIMRERSDRYARATSGSNEGLWDINVATGETFFSEGWHHILNLDPDTVHTMDEWLSRIHPDDRSAVQEALSEHMEGIRLFYETQYRIKNNRGTYVWLSDRGSRSDNASQYIAGFSRNVTREKKVEEALQSRSEELRRAKDLIEKEILNTRKFSEAVEAARDPITIMTVSGNIIYTNPARADLLGTARTQMVGAHFLAPYREKTDKKEMRAFELALRAGNPFQSENFTGLRADGTAFEAEVSLFPVRERGNVVFFTSLEQDITKRKDVDRAKTEFVSLASHQLRTPLTAIRWYSEMLLKEQGHSFSDFEKKYIKEIYDANHRMIELISALLNVSRIDLGSFIINPEPTNLVALMESVIKEMEPHIVSKHLVILRDFSRDLPLVSVDPQLFRMVFQNLLSNSAKYTHPEGRISISLKQNGNAIVFTIADTGIGIPEKQKHLVFSKLFRAENARETDPDGTGLGLYIVKAIIEASGGSIRFESQEGEGTTWYGIIPLHGSPKHEGTHALQ